MMLQLAKECLTNAEGRRIALITSRTSIKHKTDSKGIKICIAGVGKETTVPAAGRLMDGGFTA